jgi:hypothetical protein
MLKAGLRVCAKTSEQRFGGLRRIALIPVVHQDIGTSMFLDGLLY